MLNDMKHFLTYANGATVNYAFIFIKFQTRNNFSWLYYLIFKLGNTVFVKLTTHTPRGVCSIIKILVSEQVSVLFYLFFITILFGLLETVSFNISETAHFEI